MLSFKKTESRLCPSDVSDIAGGRVLIRKNIVKDVRTDANGEEITVYVYDEAVATPAEYAAFAAVRDFEARREAEIVDDYTLQLIEEGVL